MSLYTGWSWRLNLEPESAKPPERIQVVDGTRIASKAAMRRQVARFTIAVLVLSATACLSGFKHPVSPPSQGFVESGLLGAWHCADADGRGPVDLTFANFDGRQYLLQADDYQSPPSSSRVIAGRVDDATFLSVREASPKPGYEWTVLGYSFGDGELKLQYVDPDAFKDVMDDSQAVRARLSDHLQDPEVVREMLTCVQSPEKSPETSGGGAAESTVEHQR